MRFSYFALIMAVLAVIFAGCEEKETTDANQMSMNDVEEKASEAIGKAGGWLAEQKEKVVSEAEDQLGAMEKDIEQLRATAEAQGKQIQADMEKLMEDAKKQLAELKAAGQDAYDGARTEFRDSWKALKEAYEREKQKLQSRTEDANST